MDCFDPEVVVSIVDDPETVFGGSESSEVVANIENSQLVYGGSDCIEVVVNFDSDFDVDFIVDEFNEIIFGGSVEDVEVVVSCEQGPPGSGGGISGPVYHLKDGPDYQSSYVYAGYEADSGEWYIYRRTYAGNIREYAEGPNNYSTGWTNRESLSYS